MIRTSVAISAASSRPASSTRLRKRGGIHLQHLGGVGLREALERHQQEGLARPGGQMPETFLDREASVAPNRVRLFTATDFQILVKMR